MIAVVLAFVALADIVVIAALVALRHALADAEYERDRLKEDNVRLRGPRPVPSPTIGNRVRRGADATIQFSPASAPVLGHPAARPKGTSA